MPAKGKHRRPRTNPFSRGFIAAGTGGAAIALPLIGATGAHAAQQAAPATAPQAALAAAPQSAPAAAPQGAAATQVSRTAGTTVRTYAVVAGDYLSKIAEEQHVRGGWQRLYEDNRRAVGDDPGLIHPGLKLTINGKASAARSEAPTRASKSSRVAKPSESTASAESAKSSKDSSSAEPSTARSEAPAADSAAQSSASGFTLPVDGIGVGTAYRAAGGSWSSGYHTGVDFVAPSGTTVKAVGAGTVVSAGNGGAYGNQVVIQHENGMYSQYAHLSSLSVSAGQSVSTGQQIGLSGATGNVTGPHLHFEIRTGPDYGSDVDPLAFLRQNGVSI
ncbi:LysM peptidoglycan-binding domain-containing M23 family metallopeptidase [Streptomyces sp. NPDC088124]|uniref:M23 family metallopeptidase n=1 Tax=Streptomyces sp. NPDC088124 TaxID=3154654 RepID=UPI003443D970